MKFDKMQAAMVTEALDAAKLPTEGALEEQAARLEAHYNKTAPTTLLKCGDCGGISDSRLDACPFCGAADEEEETEAPEAPEDDAPESAPPPATDSKGDKKTKKGKKPEETTTMSDKKTKAKNDDATETEGKKPKVKKGEIVAPDGTIVSTKPAPVIEPLPEGVTVEKLDAAVKEVQALKGGASEVYWDLGHKIKEIHDKQLWKARRDEAGNGYKSFKQFSIEELGFSDTQSLKMMDCSTNFSREEVGKFGTSKLGLVLEAPLEARQALLKKIEDGAGKREIAGDVKTAKDDAKAKGEATGDKGRDRKGGAKNEKAGNADKTKKITVATLIGQSLKVRVWARVDKGEKARRATKIEDAPFFSYDMGNETKLVVQLSPDSDGAWDANIRFVRAVKKQKTDDATAEATEAKSEKKTKTKS